MAARRMLAYAAALISVWLVYWLAFIPGVLASDVLDQWGQNLRGEVSDWHPIFHTWFLWVASGPRHSLSAISLTQVLAAAALSGWVLATLRRLGASRRLVAGLLCWMALAPAFGMNLISIWKDTPFSLAVLGVAAIVLNATDRPLTRRAGVAIGVLCALVSLFRHNGPAVAAPTLAALAWRYRRAAPQAIALAAVVCVALVVVVRGPLRRAAGVPPASPLLTQAYLVHGVAALVHADTPLRNRDRRFLEAILPIDAWRARYECHAPNTLLFDSPIDPRPLERHPRRLVRIWVRLARANPGVALRHWYCVTRFLWEPHSSLYLGPYAWDARPDGGRLAWQGYTIDPNSLGVHTTSWFPGAQRVLLRLVEATFTGPAWLRFVFWQPAFPLYVVLAALGVALARARSSTPLLVLLPALANTAVWFVVSTGCHLRFQFPVVLLAPVAVGLTALDWDAVRRTEDGRSRLRRSSTTPTAGSVASRSATDARAARV